MNINCKLMSVGTASFMTLASAGLSGCEVGPDYTGPPVAAPVAARATGFRRAAVAPVAATPPVASWWEALGDPMLDHIEQVALDASPTVAAAVAKLRNARATVGERGASLLPNGGATGLYTRARVPTTALVPSGMSSGGMASSMMPSTPAMNEYAAVLDATWQLDIFGGTRRRIESARATADYQQAELEDAQVTLTADVAHAYVKLRDAQHRLALGQETTAVELRSLALTRQRRSLGTATDLDVERQVTQLKQSQGDVLPLAGDVEIYSDQLAQLAGQEPGMFEQMLTAARPVPLPPVLTAVGDPAAMIRRRPDIRAAERQLASEHAMIGYNVSQYFPQVTLVGVIGYTDTKASKLFTGSALTYLGGPSISWNIFNFLSIGAQVAEARASTEQAADDYRKTVLRALLDAENGLSRFGHQRDNVGVLADAYTAAAASATLANLRNAAGTISLIDDLDVERQRVQAQGNLAQGQAQLTNDWISLQSSLGLGWGVSKTDRR